MKLWPIKNHIKPGFLQGLLALLLSTGLFLLYFYPGSPEQEETTEEAMEMEGEYKFGMRIDTFEIQNGLISRGQALSQIFSSVGISQELMMEILEKGKEVLDPRTIRAGNSYQVFYTTDAVKKIAAFVYEINPLDYILCDLRDTVKVVKSRKPMEKVRSYAEAQIESSLWNALQSGGMNPLLALNISDILAWSIDFFALQKGDRFQVIYEDLRVDSVSIGPGLICAIRFDHNDRTFYGFHFKQDSAGNYWDEKGQNLRKEFLKAPLKFSRISSGFSYARRHPVLRTVRPHTGIDYAAPRGTPVMAIGDGTVIERGFQGSGGNTVKIRHNGTYTSAYLHLSKFGEGIRRGASVRQGQIIGYVGSTGLSTGPHLDFRIWKDNQPINPLTMDSPPAEPIRQDLLPGYLEYANQWKNALEQKYPGDTLALIQ